MYFQPYFVKEMVIAHAGLILPGLDLIAGGTVRFDPRWTILPPQFWDFLSVGMGGYIGGRSLEKVAGLVFPERAGARPSSRHGSDRS